MEQLIYKPARSVKQYRHTYPGQFRCQGAYFELIEGGNVVSATWNPEIGNAIPFSVYYGRDLRYHFDPELSVREVNALGRAILPLLERVRAGIEIVWNGHNNVAKLSDDACEAEDEIERILQQWY